MAVLSIFAYGSDQHGRGKDGLTTPTKTFTTAFSDACEGNKLVIDGPGTLGLEVEDNTKKAVEDIITWLESQDKDKAHVINMSGFSRGSITCIRIANRLKQVEEVLLKTPLEGLKPEKVEKRKLLLNQLQNIQLNMFLMDPVTGPLERRPKHARVIPDNVKDCVIIYQKDERRHDMTPQDLKRIIVPSPEKTKVSMLPLYGNHSDTTRIKTEAMSSGPKLNWYSMYEFFKHHGTRFKGDKIPKMVYSALDSDGKPQAIPDKALDIEKPTAKDLLNLFSEHHENEDAHHISGKRIIFFDSLPTARYERALNKDAKFYVKDPDFFVNQLERELFKIAYPRTFNYLFEHNLPDSRMPAASNSFPVDVIIELGTLKIDNKYLFERLKTKGVTFKNDKINVGEPCGYNYLEPCATVHQIFPRLVPPSFKDAIPADRPETLNKLPALEMEIYRRTFEYEREAFRGRNLKADWADRIRQETHDIIIKGSENREATRQAVLDNLEDNYKALIWTNSNSRLNGVLEKILADNGRNYAITQGSQDDQLMVEFVDHQFKLVKSTLHLVSLIVGYERGYHLDTLGRWLENWGKRAEECLGPVGYNPLKAVALVLAKTLEFIGIIVKNAFGLKPLCDLWLTKIEEMRQATLFSINETEVDLVKPETSNKTREKKEQLQSMVGQNNPKLPKEDNVSLTNPKMS